MWLGSLSQGVRHAVMLALLGLLLSLGTLAVYFTGGTRYATPYLMLVPVLLAAAGYGLRGALATALVAGGLMALMPLDVASQQPQPTLNWLIRLCLYLVIGGVAGSLFGLLRHAHSVSERLARTDPRTGLANQVALEEALRRRLAQGRQSGVGLILVRLTDIGDVLEALGPETADAMVMAMGERLGRQDRRIVEVFRFSNSELYLLLEGAGPAEIRGIAMRLAEAGEENLVVQEVPLRAQLVMGSSWQATEATTARELIRESRVAMLAAMEKHRLHCHYSADLAHDKREALQLISHVRQDLERGRFELHFQPKLRLADGRICGCEGLIRWRDDQGRLIAPGLFMPKVERTSLIAPVTRFVADQACRFAGTVDGVVGINISVRNLHDGALLDELLALSRQHGIVPERLEVEITESSLMHDLVTGKWALERLRGHGIRVSIDDFGTGFSSFEYLQYLPITGLKIDRAFIRGLDGDSPFHFRSRCLVAGLIDMGHALGLEVIAEGVETLEQHQALCRLGCDQAQGFLYTKALPAADYRAWYGQHRPAAWLEIADR
ncbi:putative bifunctional diguanylate cyclase/phosphodiesterase [Halomonas salifodinae]|uniref:Bifunctional diguanylate cyclase/phosphodiesterase n=1 Tax=Halomonas salifodinae TaxID=438745 RepID=A0ABW2EZK7_9GAMM